ncbi:MAG: pyrimidine dimer DNA glycosylase/endonuclease V [Bdellovibrionales bacterium]
MRLWSLHPRYLDGKGLVALWREGLLAQKVLQNKTKGYRFHPQLLRFRESDNPLAFIRAYLHIVCDVAEERQYAFDRDKLGPRAPVQARIGVRSGQVDYEWRHLQEKLRGRSFAEYLRNRDVTRPQLHPIFKRRRGGVEAWEVVRSV